KIRQPFNLNSLAQTGALAALDDEEHVRRTRANNATGLKFFEEAFRDLVLEFIPSSANFIVVRVGVGHRVFNELKKLGWVESSVGEIVRPMARYQLPDWIQITVGTPTENSRCLTALEKILAM